MHGGMCKAVGRVHVCVCMDVVYVCTCCVCMGVECVYMSVHVCVAVVYMSIWVCARLWSICAYGCMCVCAGLWSVYTDPGQFSEPWMWRRENGEGRKVALSEVAVSLPSAMGRGHPRCCDICTGEIENGSQLPMQTERPRNVHQPQSIKGGSPQGMVPG